MLNQAKVDDDDQHLTVPGTFVHLFSYKGRGAGYGLARFFLAILLP